MNLLPTASQWAAYTATISHGRITGYGTVKDFARKAEFMRSIQGTTAKTAENAACFLMKEASLNAMTKMAMKYEEQPMYPVHWLFSNNAYWNDAQENASGGVSFWFFNE